MNSTQTQWENNDMDLYHQFADQSEFQPSPKAKAIINPSVWIKPKSVPTLPAKLQAHYTPECDVKAPMANNNPTILIIGAYPVGDIQADLALHCAKYNLPPLNNVYTGENNPLYANFYVYYQSSDTKTFSQTPRPMLQSDSWYKEMCIDTQTAHSIAPYANIILIYANSGSDLLYQAMEFGLSLSSQFNIVSVSTSWGGKENSVTDAKITSILTPYPQIICCSSTGDNGTALTINSPSSNANVLAVGGTSISPQNVDLAWNGTQSGMSSFVPKPSYQLSGIPAKYTMRAVPDVSMLGDTETGVAIVYKGTYLLGAGGTSVSAPLMAGFIAVLIQQHMKNNNSTRKTNLRSSDFKKILYGNRQNELDVTTPSTLYLKNNIWTNVNYPSRGYDLCGLGVPIFKNLLANAKFIVS
jgi:subtilase family serine protease